MSFSLTRSWHSWGPELFNIVANMRKCQRLPHKEADAFGFSQYD